MPAIRRPLSDKEQRILVQAQLMGLSTESMVRIGNRLKALEEEQRNIEYVHACTDGYTWNIEGKTYTVKDREGYEYMATATGNKTSHWYSKSTEFAISIHRPGTDFKPVITTGNMNILDTWKKRLMPQNSKELFAFIRWVGVNNDKFKAAT